jgi:hypothetical protein
MPLVDPGCESNRSHPGLNVSDATGATPQQTFLSRRRDRADHVGRLPRRGSTIVKREVVPEAWARRPATPAAGRVAVLESLT